MLCQAILRQAGDDVVTACDGEDALTVMLEQARPVHLVLTDVVMPRLDGRRFVERARQRFPSVKVIFMSGYTEDEQGPALRGVARRRGVRAEAVPSRRTVCRCATRARRLTPFGHRSWSR